MLKGARKAIVRAPHRLAGSKSIEDRIIIEWTKDFGTAEAALDFLVSEIAKFSANWKVICTYQVSLAEQFNALYEPIVEDNVYSMTQETPESSIVAIQGYLAAIKEVEAKILPMLAEFEIPFVAKCKTAKECIHSVHKALKKRERKKLDFDQHSNAVDKMLRKHEFSDKDQLQLGKLEQELDAATDIFHAQDEKVKSIIPYVLTTMSELLNPLTSQLYLMQLDVYKIWTETLFAYSQAQGLTGTMLSVAALGKPVLPDSEADKSNGETETYEAIAEAWETQFMTLQPRCEQGLETIRNGKAITKSMRSEHEADKEDDEAKLKRKHEFKFTSPQGMFWTEADLLAAYTHYHNNNNSNSSRGGSTPSSPASMSHRSMATGSPSIPGVFNGRTPVTTVIVTEPTAETEQLRTRVRVTMSTAARTLSLSGDLGDDIEVEEEAVGFNSPSSLQAAAVETILRPRSHSKALSVRSAVVASSISSNRSGSNRSSSTISTSATNTPLHLPPSYNSPGNGGGSGSGSGSGSGTPHNSRSRFSADGPSAIPTSVPNEKAVAVYTFSGYEPGDVAFKKGDLVTVLDHGTETDDQWWFGQTADGRLGLFPRNYVQIKN